MNVLMLGWEYPPHISGGLGIASQGLAKQLSNSHDIDFLIPKLKSKHHSKRPKLLEADNMFSPTAWYKEKKKYRELNFLEIEVELIPYLPAKYFEKYRTEILEEKELTPTEESEIIEAIKLTGTYSKNLFAETKKYALISAQIAGIKKYDVVHCHDWMTFSAGIAIQKSAQIPFVAHIHSTEIDRNGVFANKEIFEFEKAGLIAANLVICVSQKVKNLLINHYKIPEKKIKVVPNGFETPTVATKKSSGKKSIPTVGFAGRLVEQKGPLRFVDIARKIKNSIGEVNFSVCGDGHLLYDLKQKVSHSNLESSFQINGFLNHEKMMIEFGKFDVLIMPSISEPFGLVALEAINLNVPVVCSNQSGILDFIPSIPNFEYWDDFSVASTAVKLIQDEEYKKNIVQNCRKEAEKLTWKHAATSVSKLYTSII